MRPPVLRALRRNFYMPDSNAASLGRELWSLGPAAAPVKPNLHFESAR
jgi:hypothetical protein